MEDQAKEEGADAAAWAAEAQGQEETVSAHPAAIVSLTREGPPVPRGHVPSAGKP